MRACVDYRGHWQHVRPSHWLERAVWMAVGRAGRGAHVTATALILSITIIGGGEKKKHAQNEMPGRLV